MKSISPKVFKQMVITLISWDYGNYMIYGTIAANGVGSPLSKAECEKRRKIANKNKAIFTKKCRQHAEILYKMNGLARAVAEATLNSRIKVK